MRSLIIHLDLLTDRYAAGDTKQREAPEWPPHPGRLFMALAATCFETGGDESDIAALKWLEQQSAPEVHCGHPQVRTPIAVYVPVNDKPSGGGILQTAPGVTRSRQERTFPTVIPESPTVRMVWNLADDADIPIEALDRLCGETIRLGHSSSLVNAAAMVRDDAPAIDDTLHRWVPVDGGGQQSLRIPGVGAFDRLVTDGKRETIERFVELADAIESSKGKDKIKSKELFEQEFGTAYKQSVRPPEPTPATVRTFHSYRNENADSETTKSGESRALTSGHMRHEMLVLAKHDGPNYSLGDTLMLTRQLRNVILKRCQPQPAPDWISGHDAPNTPTRLPHIAIVPLPYVGTKHADGHLMGMGILTPKHILPSEIGRSLGPVLVDDEGEPRAIELQFNQTDDCCLRLENRDEPAINLREPTWLRPSRTWCSVTPVVLDRFPKKDKRKDPGAWREEVAKIIWRSCGYAGIEPPTQVEVSSTAFLCGVPRSVSKIRRRRESGQSGTERQASNPIGDGFPPFTIAKNKPPRVQVHVRLTFDRPHAGPMLIGAGRFLGYGWFRPSKQAEENR